MRFTLTIVWIPALLVACEGQPLGPATDLATFSVTPNPLLGRFEVIDMPRGATSMNDFGHLVGPTSLGIALWTPVDGVREFSPGPLVFEILTANLNNADEVAGLQLELIDPSIDALLQRAYRWTEDSGFDELEPIDVTFRNHHSAVLSENGHVAGVYDPGGSSPSRFELFRWTTTAGFEVLGSPDLGMSGVVIDDGGRIAGNSNLSIFRWTDDTGFETLVPTQTAGIVESMNARGEVAGRLRIALSDPFRLFRWTEGGGFEDLGTPGEDVLSVHINDSGDIAGKAWFSGTVKLFLWSEQTGFQVPELPIQVLSIPDLPFNNQRQIAGSYRDNSGQGGIFRWGNRVGFQDLGMPAGGTHVLNVDLNEAGQIAGSVLVDGATKAFLWTPRTPPELLQQLIAQVNFLVETGGLGNGNANALITKLQNAQRRLTTGNTNAALGQLNAFINQVDAFVASGRLTEEEATLLVATAQSVVDQLGG